MHGETAHKGASVQIKSTSHYSTFDEFFKENFRVFVYIFIAAICENL
jgi:hypothetical protein